MDHYDGSLAAALIDVFPDMRFDPSLFGDHSSKFSFPFSFPSLCFQLSLLNHCIADHWGDKRNRVKYFIDFAASHGFDPLIASRWHSFDHQDFKVLPSPHCTRFYFTSPPL